LSTKTTIRPGASRACLSRGNRPFQLAARAPTLREAVDVAHAKAYVILDGTLLLIDRIAADHP
jgi:hypothetical protein